MDLSSYVLAKLFKDPALQFEAKLGRLASHNRKYALADLADYLNALSPEELGRIFLKPWKTLLPAQLSNYVAAMLELSAHQKNLPTPKWLKNIEPDKEPYFGTDLKGLRLYLLKVSPPPFKARNIFIDTSIGGRI